MKKPALSSFLLIIFMLLLSSTAVAQAPQLFTDDFEAEAHPNWSLDAGWGVIEEDGNAVLEGQGHTWARIEQLFPGDFQLTLRIRVISGRIHLVTHLSDEGRYFLGIGGQPAALNKQYFPDDFQEGLAVSSQTLRDNSWHALEIISEGDTIQLFLDGVNLWEYQDPEPLQPGLIAFESLEGSRIQLDDISVVSLGEPAVGAEGDEEPFPEEGHRSEISDSAGWIRTGGPLGGLGYDVRMHPQNPDRMYVTDAYAGVFLSEDGGKTWFPSNKGITDRTGESQDAIPVFCLTIDPNTPEIIWAGTQYSGGIFKSEDGGKSWNKTTTGITIQDGLTFRGISVDPTDSQTVYAAGELSSWAWSGEPLMGREWDITKGVLYKSGNGGESWQEIWRGDNLARYILIHPQDPQVLYLSTGIFDREAANSIPDEAVPGGVGVLKSTDGGETWRGINEGLKNLFVGSLSMHPENPDVILAGVGNNQYYQNAGVYRTENGGKSWEKVNSGQEVSINSVEFAPSNPEIAYAGGDPMILRSEDGGRTWRKVSEWEEGWGAPGVRGGFPIDFEVDPRDPNRIFANNYGGGNFLSEDGGRTWEVASAGYTGAQVRSVAVDPEHPGRVYVAARSGIFVSSDGGNTWDGLAFRPHTVLEWNAVAIDPTDPSHLVSGNNWVSQILYSEKAGNDWESVSEFPGPGHGIRVFAFQPADPSHVFAGSGAFYSAGVFDPQMPSRGIFHSRDGGRSWNPSTSDQFSDAHVLDISFPLDDSDQVYAASSNYGVLKSQDAGESWVQVNDGLTEGRWVNAVAVDPHNNQRVYAGISFGGIFRSEDGGQSWTQTSVGLPPEADISSIVIHPEVLNIVFAADKFTGVNYSTDGGDTWQRFNKDLRMKAVNQLAISADGKHLYAATEGEGVYRLDLAGEPPPPAPELVFFEEPEESRFGDEIGLIEEEPEPEPGEVEDPDPASESQPPEEDPPADLRQRFCPGSSILILAAVLISGGRSILRSRKPRR